MNIPHRIVAATFVACVFASAGCGGARIGGSSKPDKVIDQLRTENRKLEDEVARLNTQIQTRLAELESVRADKGIPAPTADVPRLHEVVIASLSGAVDSDDDGKTDLIRLYVVTKDQHSRTLPVEAMAQVQAVRSGPDKPPYTVAERSFTVEQFRDAYRSGFGGTHYTLELPVDVDKIDMDQIVISVFVQDAATGVMHVTHKPVKLLRSSRQ